MKKIGIFYGSTTGNTEEVAMMIGKRLGVDMSDIHDVADTAPSAVGDYDVMLFGCSTWGDGDMQDGMHDFLDGVMALDLAGKKSAVFGCGDETMAETFCNGVGEMYRMLKNTGVEMIGGDFDTDGYKYDHTDADVNGRIVGLLIDNMNHPDLTAGKVDDWCDSLESVM